MPGTTTVTTTETTAQGTKTTTTTTVSPTQTKGLGYTVATDPRLDARIKSDMTELGLGGPAAECPFTISSPVSDILKWSVEVEGIFEPLLGSIKRPPLPIEIDKSTEIIKGVDGNDITLHISKPKAATGPLPCIYHTHGGGMAILHAEAQNYVFFRDRLACEGVVVVGVAFRNCAGADGHNPFPAGLNDCASGLYWVADNKAKLGISSIVISGESGGGNLALATTMKAKIDGRLDVVDGTYALCPYIAGPTVFVAPPAELPKMIENDGIFINLAKFWAPLAHLYSFGGNETNPLAWPYFATAADLKGLPPCVVSVNESDPLVAEGIAFGSKLVEAGVDACTVNVMGTVHASDTITVTTHMFNTMRNIAAFAQSRARGF